MTSDAAAMSSSRIGITRAWYALAILLIVYAFNYIDRYLLAGLAEPIKADFGVSDGFLGFLLGPAFAVLYTTAAIPIARLADRMSRVVILAVGCAVWSLFTALSGYATGATSFALMRLGVGLGEAAFLAPAYSLLADRRAGGPSPLLSWDSVSISGRSVACPRARFSPRPMAGGAPSSSWDCRVSRSRLSST